MDDAGMRSQVPSLVAAGAVQAFYRKTGRTVPARLERIDRE
jgi:hypothetical protein